MRLEISDSVVLIIDIQEKLFPHMSQREELREKNVTLLAGTASLGVPRLAARQYPQGLGDMIEPIRPYFPAGCWDKTTFSCCGSEPLMAELRAAGRKNVIIAGIETHICVLQTVVDLKELGFLPVVVVDAVSSRKERDTEIGLRRMEQEGAVLTTVESILFELCRQAGSETFKTISRLVK